MTIDVLVDSHAHAWQCVVTEIVGERHETRVHAIVSDTPGRQPLSVRLYARLDRWAPPARGESSKTPPLDEILASAEVVVDLTAAQVSMGRRTSATTVLLPRPSRLDEAALLDVLVARETTIGLEVVNAAGEPVAASTIALARLSPRKSSSRAAHRVGALLERALEGHPGGERLERQTIVSAPRASPAGIGALLVDAVLTAGRIAMTRRKWRVAIGTVGEVDPFSLPTEWRPINAPAGHWYADPFLACGAEGTFLFVEDFDVSLGRAEIAAIDLQSGHATTVVSAEHHLSYPFVFEVDGAWYMLPETSAANQVTLYRCEEFPYRWVRDTVLLDSVVAYDTTLLHRDGLWWLFFASGPRGTRDDDELQLWFAEQLRGSFQPHPLNPVRSNIGGSRPAGRILARDQRLFRPAQDGSREYGGSIVIHEIDCLSTTNYAEHTFGRIDPSELDALGIHTYDRVDDLVVVDTKHATAKISRH